MAEKLKGEVQWFNNAKGFGFIKREDQQKDVFVHFSGIQVEGKYKSLAQGDKVEFDIVQGTKGPQAVHVVLLQPAEA